MNNEITLGAFTYLRANNINIPRDISVAAFGDINNKDLLYITPTLSYFDLHSVGIKIGELMIERIENNNRQPNREIRFVTSLQIGESTKIFSE